MCEREGVKGGGRQRENEREGSRVWERATTNGTERERQRVREKERTNGRQRVWERERVLGEIHRTSERHNERVRETTSERANTTSE